MSKIEMETVETREPELDRTPREGLFGQVWIHRDYTNDPFYAVICCCVDYKTYQWITLDGGRWGSPGTPLENDYIPAKSACLRVEL
jgi:hypothetical protein